MEDLLKEYQVIVTGTRHLLETKLRKSEKKRQSVRVPAPKKVEPVVVQEEEPLQTLPPEPKKEVLVKCVDEVKQGSFILEKTKSIKPLDLTPMKELIHSIAPPPQVALLSFAKEPFLDKVAAALTKHGLRSITLTLEESSLTKSFFTTTVHTIFITEWRPLFATITPLPKEYHKLFTFSHQKRILFLHPIHSYETDIELKQHLWNTLKTQLLQ